MTPGTLSATPKGHPITGSASWMITSAPGSSAASWAASVRAGRSCPSPIDAVRIRTLLMGLTLTSRVVISTCSGTLLQRPVGRDVRVAEGPLRDAPGRMSQGGLVGLDQLGGPLVRRDRVLPPLAQANADPEQRPRRQRGMRTDEKVPRLRLADGDA